MLLLRAEDSWEPSEAAQDQKRTSIFSVLPFPHTFWHAPMNNRPLVLRNETSDARSQPAVL